MRNSRLWQTIGIVVIVGAVIAVVFVTIAVVNDNEPVIENRITNESDN